MKTKSVSRKKIILFFMVVFFCTTLIKAQTYITIPDANFAAYLQSIIPAAMSGNQLNTSSTLVTTSTHAINVGNSNISDLTGIQYFSSLDTLFCYYNSLTNLPSLPNSLQILYCNGNSLTALPGLPNSITHLDCNQNFLTTLPVLPASLVLLNCNNNPLSTLPSLPHSLHYLYCVQDSLTSLPALDSSLQILQCQFNHLTSFPPIPPSLRALNCSNNNITCLPYFPSSVDSLGMGQNPFTCLPNYIAVMGDDTTQYPLCSVSNSNGCMYAGIDKHMGSNAEITIYPNPTKGEFIIEVNSAEKQTVQIFDVNGKLMLSKITWSKNPINASNLEDGIYHISITNAVNTVNKSVIICR
jgi:hypothetical protein